MELVPYLVVSHSKCQVAKLVAPLLMALLVHPDLPLTYTGIRASSHMVDHLPREIRIEVRTFRHHQGVSTLHLSSRCLTTQLITCKDLLSQTRLKIHSSVRPQRSTQSQEQQLLVSHLSSSSHPCSVG